MLSASICPLTCTWTARRIVAPHWRRGDPSIPSGSHPSLAHPVPSLPLRRRSAHAALARARSARWPRPASSVWAASPPSAETIASSCPCPLACALSGLVGRSGARHTPRRRWVGALCNKIKRCGFAGKSGFQNSPWVSGSPMHLGDFPSSLADFLCGESHDSP